MASLTSHALLRRYLFGLLFVCICMSSNLPAAEKKTLLVLHSYHRGLGWTDTITEGIEAAFRKSGILPEIHYEYMDTKRIFDPQHLDNVAQLLQHKYAGIRLDAIISSDDHAFHFLLQHHNRLFPQVPVVFCGVNGFKDEYLAEKSWYTGVIEAFSIKGTIDSILQLEPGVSNIYAIADDTLTGRTNKRLVEALIPAYRGRAQIHFLEGFTSEALQQRVANLSPDSALIYLSFTTDAAGENFSLEQGADLITASANRPLYSFWDFHLHHGVIGGKLISGAAQGETAAALVLRLFAGESVADIPVVRESPNRYIFDYTILQKFNISLSRLPEGSTVIDQPPSFYQEYRRLVWLVIGVMLSLLIVIISISFILLQRRRAEEALRRSEGRLRAVLRAADDVAFIIARTAGNEPSILEFSPGAENIFGYSRAEMIGQPLALLRLPAGVLQDITDTLEADREHSSFAEEAVLTRKNLQTFPALFSTYPLFDSEGPAWGRLLVVFDVTARKETEQALRESEERFRELAELLPETIYELDIEGNLLFVNQSGLSQFKVAAEDVVKRKKKLTIFDFFPEREHARLRQRLGTLRNGQDASLHEYTGRRSNGEEFPLMARSTPIVREDQVVGVRGFLIDISEKKRIEDQMRNAQRMESIGTLAGGIAHDFNNLLMGIQGRTSLALLDVEPQAPVYEHLKGIEDYVQSAAHLTKQLLGFARSGKYDLKATDINRLIEKSVEMFGRTSKELQMDCRLAPGVWSAKIDRSQIEQVLLNIYINAWQAMSGKGTITVTTENILADGGQAQDLSLAPGPHVRIVVADTGPGIDPDIQEKIFEPFVTTKPRGRGTGLGLASAYGIIRNHKGSISVISEPGQGAAFQIHLPASMEQPELENEQGEALLPGDETILLVDDEAMVLEVATELLKRLGYTVLPASGGEEALRLQSTPGSRIDLVILDMIMPGLSGDETFDLLRQHNPSVKILLSSGYSADGRAARIMAKGCNGFIQKPFDLLTISQKIRTVIDSP